MLLSEKLYKKLSKIFYHGTMWGLDKENSRFKFFFITTKFNYALTYAIDEESNLQEESTIYELKLKEGINLFNANNPSDYSKLERYLMENGETMFLRFLPSLKEMDWTLLDAGDEYYYKNRERLFDILIKLGFTGFFNYEATSQKTNYDVIDRMPSFGILNFSSLVIVGEHHGNDIKDMCEYKRLNEFERTDWNDNLYVYKKNGLSKDDIINGKMADIFGAPFTKHSDVHRYLTLSRDEMIGMIDSMDLESYRENRMKNGPYNEFYLIMENEGKEYIQLGRGKKLVEYW